MTAHQVVHDDGMFRVEAVGNRSTAQHCPECNEWQRGPIEDCACGRWFNDIGGIEEPEIADREHQ